MGIYVAAALAMLCLVVGAVGGRPLFDGELTAQEDAVNSCAERAIAADPRIKTYVSQLARCGVWDLLGKDLPVDSTLFVPAAALKGSNAESNPFAIALYQMITIGSFSIQELIDDESIVTALPSHTMAFGRDREGAWVAIPNGDRARVLRSMKICDTYIHIIDHALIPGISGEDKQGSHSLAEGPEASPRHLVEINDLFAPSPVTSAINHMLETVAAETAALLPVDKPARAAAPAPAA